MAIPGACPAIIERGGGANLRQLFIAIRYSCGSYVWPEFVDKGPGSSRRLRGGLANHYLDIWSATSFCVAFVTFASSL